MANHPTGTAPPGELVPYCPSWCRVRHDDAGAVRVHTGQLTSVTTPGGAPLFLVDAVRIDARNHPGNERFGWEVGEVVLTVTAATPGRACPVEDLSLDQAAALADFLAEVGGHPLDVPALLRDAVATVREGAGCGA